MQKFVLPFILLIVLLFYSPVFSVYFSHDDFFHLKASQTDGTVSSFINLFGFLTFEERGYGFYRPLTREVFFNIYYSLFGLNHVPARIILLVIHSINIIFIYLLMKKLFRKRRVALFTSFFFGITAANVGGLYYLAGGIQSLLATTFILSTVLLFSKKVSFITFLLALSSHELASVVPFVLVGLAFAKKNLLKNLKFIMLFFIILVIFVYLDVARIGFSSRESQYQFNFELKSIVNSLSWYSLWALGIPEMFVDFIGPKFSVNPNLMKFWGDYASGIFFFSGVALTVLVVSLVLACKDGILRDRRVWFLILWFPLALSPVLLLPLHKQTYYLIPALPAFWGLVGVIVFNAHEYAKARKIKIAHILSGVFLTSLVALSVTSVTLADKTYPAANRGRIAEKLIKDVTTQYPQLSKGAVVYFKNDPNYPKISGSWGGSSKQADFALNGSDALQLVYQDMTLQVVYEDFAPEPRNSYPLVAKINE